MNDHKWSEGARAACCVLVLFFAGMPRQSFAQTAPDDATRAVARELGTQGVDAFRAGDFAAADVKLDQAFRLYAVPTLGLWSARSRIKLGRLVEAAERLRDVTHISAAIGNNDTQREAQRDAAAELAELLPRIPTLTVQLDNAAPADVIVTLDGTVLASGLIGMARPTDIGKHSLTATRASERVELQVELVEGDAQVSIIHFPLQPAAAKEMGPPRLREPAKASPLKPIAGIALGVGALGLSTWAVGALVANGKLNKCPLQEGKHICDSQSQADAYSTWKTLSAVGFYTGIAFTVAGLGTWLWAVATDDREQSAQALSWSIGPLGASVQGRF